MKKAITQSHHISYDPEVKVTLYKGEHLLLIKLAGRRKISKGFITALKVWITLNEDKAKEVDNT